MFSLYDSLVTAIRIAAEVTLPKGQYNKHAKPYWTDEVKEAHRQQRQKRVEWVKQGRPRNNENVYYRSYKDAKRFRKIQWNAINTIELKYNSELDETAECDTRLFWRRKTKQLYSCLQVGYRRKHYKWSWWNTKNLWWSLFKCLFSKRSHKL